MNRPMLIWWQMLGLSALIGFPPGLQAGCTGDGKSGGILKLDRCDEFEAHGIYSRRNQQWLNAIVIGGTVGFAFWEGTESPEGRTAWKSLDSMAMAAVTTELLKNVVQRPRPSESDNPNLWRQGSGNKSFPSGETANIAAFVTPIILEYQQEHPAVWALSVLPVYMGKARMGSQGHWLSDVLAGAALGVTTGYYATRRDSPLLLELTPDGVFVGLKHRF
jgi:membrane-associated phospholipid phosphatase